MGFRSSYQAQELIHTFRQIVQLSEEWRLGLCVARLDVHKAFDRVRTASVLSALRHFGAGEAESAAIVRESAAASMVFHAPGGHTSAAVRRQRGVCQGMPSSPLLFASVLARALNKLHHSWKHHGLAWHLDEVTVSNLQWADDVWLFARSPSMLQIMIRELLQEIETDGLHIDLREKAAWCSRESDATTSAIIVHGITLQRTSRSVGLPVLGTCVSFDGRCSLEVANRISAAWRSFWAKRRFLRTRSLDPRLRLQAMEAFMQPTVLWAAGRWRLSRADLASLNAAQSKMTNLVLGMYVRPDESASAFCRRRNRRARQLRMSMGIDRWDVAACRRIFRWGGHVARMDQHRLAAQTTALRGNRWRLARQALTGSQGHRGQVYCWRWEDQFQQWPGVDQEWQQHAQDRDTWALIEPDWIQWRLRLQTISQ